MKSTRLRLLAATFLASLGLLTTVAPAAVAETEPPVSQDPALQQEVKDDEHVSEGLAEVEVGHVDLGPKAFDGAWKFMARDDTATPPVWRNPHEMVLRVKDTALLTVPADPQFEFLGLPADKQVHTIPQTQNTDVIWLGWNSQDPSVIPDLADGMQFVLHDVQGPGALHVFLTSGFDKPIELWNSTTLSEGEQGFWVEGNTHVHANWIFTEPGVYLVKAEFRQGRSGNAGQSATGTLVFAVGDATTTAQALEAVEKLEQIPTPSTDASESPSATPAASAAASEQPSESAAPAAVTPERPAPNNTVWIVAGVAGVVLVLVGVGAWLFVMRSRLMGDALDETEGATP